MRDWLKQLRKKRGLTQAEVASRAYINRAYYSQIEQGNRTPSIEVAKGIADILGFSPSRLYFEEAPIQYETALKNAPIIIAHCDLDLRYTWIYNPHPDFELENVIGKKDDELAYNEGIIELMALKQKVIQEGKALTKQIRFPLKDGLQTYQVFCEPLTNADGEIYGVSTASMEIKHS